MNIRTLVLLGSLGFAGPALAGSCENLMSEIDDTLAQRSDLATDIKEQVMVLRAEGEMLHVNGRHEASEETLQQALALLGAQ